MIFLSYAREDESRAARLYSMLERPDRPVFYDKKALVPGMDWRDEIEYRLKTSSLIIILCSRHSVYKEGFVQKEIRLAAERAEMMPDRRIFVMPLRFDGVTVPQKLARYQWLDINKEDDIFDTIYYVEWALNLIQSHNNEVIIDYRPNNGEDIDLLKRPDIVMRLDGKNSDGETGYCYEIRWEKQRR